MATKTGINIYIDGVKHNDTPQPDNQSAYDISDVKNSGESFDIQFSNVYDDGGESDLTVIQTFVLEDTTAPTIQSATIENANPDQIVVPFDEDVNVSGVTGLSITGDETPTIDSVVSGSGTNTVTFQLSAAVSSGSNLTLEVAATNDIADIAGNDLAATTEAITNNVSEGGEVLETFDGTTIDTNKFTVINPDSSTISISQNDSLILEDLNQGEVSSSFDNRVEHNVTWEYKDLRININSSGSDNTPVAVGAMVDESNLVTVARGGGTNEYLLLIIKISGENVVSFATDKTWATTTDLRIVVNKFSIDFYRSTDNASTWEYLNENGETYVQDIDGLKRFYTGIAAEGGRTLTLDNLELKNVVVEEPSQTYIETFDGTTIDTNKFTVTNEDSPAIEITQNDALLLDSDGSITQNGSFSNRINYDTGFTDGVVEFALSHSGDISCAWGMGVMIDTDNFAGFYRGANADSLIRILIRVAGATVVEDDDLLVYDNATNFRIVVKGDDWIFQKSTDNGQSWIYVGSYVADLGANKKWYAGIGSTTSGAKNITISELKIEV